ncbi:MAG: ABC transporter permease [Firmicutes bacterium]|jgi:ABC-type dipeptide/oligopeptide/nickel transport system permease component|nr:ABC transporter permease [Bacillota bacterium]MBQ2058628.1 ABC transporter permease [Bacillota bacterium]MBQ4371053.1 ABC transporter permease [Bacillota bacterium]
MGKYVLKRVGLMVLSLFIIISVAFFALRLIPGGPYDDDPDLAPEAQAALIARMNLDKPLPVQYVLFIKGILMENNWGASLKLRPGISAFDIIKERVPATMLLNIMSLLISLPLGILAGTLAALYKSKWPDALISVLVILCISVPSFIFATLLQYFPAYRWELFPLLFNATGNTAARLKSMILPVMALSFGPIATVCRYLRGELIETLSSEYMLLARTKGLKRAQAIARHAFRNSCVPLANIIIPMFTNIMGGSLVVETLFSVPGIGTLIVDSINTRDYTVTMAALLFYSFISVMTILIVDLSYGLIDPRIRLGAKGNE